MLGEPSSVEIQASQEVPDPWAARREGRGFDLEAEAR